jgi:hypothetical protein
MHLVDNDTAVGVGMAVGLVIAPLCFVIAIVLGAWHRWRKWTGADQESISLGFAEKPPGDTPDKR